MAGKATFFEKLNENSDLPKDVFENEKEGELFTPFGRALGELQQDESERFTHPDLERVYRITSRADLPKNYDAGSLGKNAVFCFDARFCRPPKMHS